MRMATTEGNISLTATNIAAENDVSIRGVLGKAHVDHFREHA